MAQLMNIRLGRHDAQPWGFRLQGGKDFGTPLVVQKVNGGSIAEQAGLIPGDAVLKINNVDVFNLRHKDAQDVIVRSGNSFDITIQRGGSTWRPQVTPVGQVPSAGYGNSIPTVTKTSLAHKPQEVRHIGSGYNSSARPFSSVNGSDGHLKSIVNKQYNTPVGIYSEEAIAETLSAQAEVLAGGVLGVNFKKNEKVYNAANSEVYKFLHEQDQGEPAERPPHFVEHNPQQHYETPQQQYQQHQHSQQQHHQHQQHQQHQQQQSANHPVAAVTRHVMAPANQPKAPSTGGLPTGQNICANCERLIVGVFVRIKDKNLHVDCFKCATCGTSLKNQGYYNFNNKLYCDIHAKLAAINNPPPGTEGYMPVPIKPCTKLSASTISAAINAHQSNGTSHLIGSPTSNANQQDQTPPPFQPSHSRTSSSSSVGTTNSCISSLSPNISSTPEKLSPVHSRQSSGSGSILSGPGAGSVGLQHLKGISVPPISFGTMSSTGESIIYKQNENDMNSNNRNMTSNGALGGTESGTPQSAYNQFMKKYNDTINGGNKSSFGDTNGINSAANVTLTGAPGYGHQEATPTESLYGSIRADTKIQPHDEFQYVTLDGSVIKSVIPPGKGIKTNYKVNQGYGGPKPFNMSPKTPPISGPKSPSTYPPPSQAPSWGQPKQAMNPYATLPRSTGPSQDDTNIPVPPPPPLPVQAAKSNGFNSLRRVNGERGQRLGKATEMLASSLERLDINAKDNFKVEAGKILSSMLEARLSGKTSPRPPPPLPPQPIETAPHPMKNVIDICDASVQNKSPPLPADTVKQLQAKVEPVSIDPIKQIKDRDNPVNTLANGKVQELEPLETVIYRNKSTNPNAKRELTSHALDRRSYIEKDQQSFEQDNRPEIVADVGNDVQPEKIASELRDGKHPICCQCNAPIMRGPFITALGRIWCPEHFVCVNANCRRPLQDIGFVEEKGDLYCEYCFEKYLAPSCSKCNAKIKGDCLNAIGKHFHPECFTCSYCGKLFGNSPFFLEEGEPYCEADWNELFTTKCFACGFPVEAGDRWVEALNHNYHSQCFNCTMCKKNLEGQSFYNKGGRPFCKNHAR